MPTATEQITKVEDQILETLTKLQTPVVDAVKTVAEKVEDRLPEVPGADKLPDWDELIQSQYAFVEKLVANQKAFVTALVEALKPAAPKAPAAKPKTTRTAATKAA